MSIFGVLYPKIVEKIDTTLDEVLLQHAVVLKDKPELDTYGVRAVRTGKRVFNNAGKHWLFQVKIYLWKYADTEAKYLELKGYEGTKVYLYRHADGELIYDTYDNAGVFYLSSVVNEYTDEHNKYDVAILTFKSLSHIKVGSIPEVPYHLAYLTDYSKIPDELTQPPSVNIPPVGKEGTRSPWSVVNSLHWYSKGNEAQTSAEQSDGMPKEWEGVIDRVDTFLNGYRLISTELSSYAITNQDRDIFNGLIDFSVLFAFKRNTSAVAFNTSNGEFLLWLPIGTAQSNGVMFINIGTDYKISAKMEKSSIPVSCAVASSVSVVDNTWHICYVGFGQSTKTIIMAIDGEYLTNTQGAYEVLELTNAGAGGLAKTKLFNVKWWDGYELATYRGLFGDLLIYNKILSKSEINKSANAYANKFGLTWDNVL